MIAERDARTIEVTAGIIAGGLIGILGFVTWALVFRTIPESNNNTLTLLIGILSTNVGTIVGYHFGASVASKKLADAVNTQAKTAQTAGAALNTPDNAFVIPEGETATATATPSGTVIKKDTPDDTPIN